MVIPDVEKVDINMCPNSSDSRNDCKDCSFGCGWHLIKGKCQPKEGIDIAPDYSGLKFHLGYIMKKNKSRKKITNHNNILKKKKVEEDAVWV